MNIWIADDSSRPPRINAYWNIYWLYLHVYIWRASKKIPLGSTAKQMTLIHEYDAHYLSLFNACSSVFLPQISINKLPCVFTLYFKINGPSSNKDDRFNIKDHTWTFCPYRLPRVLWTTKCNGKDSYLIFYIWKLATYDFTNATWVEYATIGKILPQKQSNKTTEKYFIAE